MTATNDNPAPDLTAIRERLAKAEAERDSAHKTLSLVRHILYEPTENWEDEAKALEPGKTPAACLLIDLANQRYAARAKIQQLNEMRAERDAILEFFIDEERDDDDEDWKPTGRWLVPDLQCNAENGAYEDPFDTREKAIEYVVTEGQRILARKALAAAGLLPRETGAALATDREDT